MRRRVLAILTPAMALAMATSTTLPAAAADAGSSLATSCETLIDKMLNEAESLGVRGDARATCTGTSALALIDDSRQGEMSFATTSASQEVYRGDSTTRADRSSDFLEDAEAVSGQAEALATFDGLECSEYQIVRDNYNADTRACIYWAYIASDGIGSFNDEARLDLNLGLQAFNHYLHVSFQDRAGRRTMFESPIRMRQHQSMWPDDTVHTIQVASADFDDSWSTNYYIGTNGAGTFFAEIYNTVLTDEETGIVFPVAQKRQTPRFDCTGEDYSCIFQDPQS